ncbi:response regulator transcription factor family protein [Nonomuraea roseoviolacea]|uniref:DNA-binding NarL/FixJ family response regulator n=1 Tax=Nonomuraea roseoviolacea subsp. carminata TaxID=160689 RepID=A0ABT1K4S7_9ACTN|nr:LuxR C-terminal-related transcriptional regulator [Nonomuraea roseoviolacea]MCP2349008.1 DNA-binding NarL/FixJ family response regulator [Nonomuraea roseoviolacea subsp. carminata]
MELSDPRAVLAAVTSVLRAPIGGILEPLSEVLAEFLPHRALAMLTGDCARHPLRTHGEQPLAGRITSGELARAGAGVEVGEPWFGHARLAGESRLALIVASRPAGTSGALLAVVTDGDGVPGPMARDLVRLLWELLAGHVSDRGARLPPADLAGSRVAAGERARVIAELTDAHAATLASLLATLRSRTLGDAAARAAATDLAVSALIELRATGDLDRSLSEQSAGAAFDRLAGRLAPLTRHSEVALELVGPRAAERSIPADVAHAAQAVVRGCVVSMLEHEGVRRIRAAWELEEAALRVVVRDDGPGVATADDPPMRRLTELATALGGRLTLDAVPGWGTTVTAALPLAPAVAAGRAQGPLSALRPRELDVLERLARGLRNRRIAEELRISEHTVKFHVANILDKLGVTTRTEAAALAHASGFPSVA